MRKVIHVVVVVVLLMILPVTLLAQDELTLEGLAGIVEDIEDVSPRLRPCLRIPGLLESSIWMTGSVKVRFTLTDHRDG